ncbi:MAG: hypothetical protein RSA70_06245 [Clostridia bacterium]
MMEEEKKIVERGRGGVNNFGNNKRGAVKTEEDRKLVSGLLQEVNTVYKMPKVKSDEELSKRISDYYLMCAERGQIPTVEEMVMSTGYSYAAIYDWENGRRHGFSPDTADIIKKAKDFMKTFDAKLVVSGKLNFLTYCFRAKNYYGMVDKQEYVLTPNNLLEPTTTPEDMKRLIDSSIPDDE